MCLFFAILRCLRCLLTTGLVHVPCFRILHLLEYVLTNLTGIPPPFTIRHKSCSHAWEGHFMQCFIRRCSFNFVSQPSRPCLVPLLQIRGINTAPSILSVLLQMPARKKHTGVLPPKRFWKWIQPLLAWEIMEGSWNLDILALAVTKPPAWLSEQNLKSLFS